MDWAFGSTGYYGATSLPKECSCNNTSHKTHCSGTGLCNHICFPPFAYLPEENDIGEHYYDTDDENGYFYSPRRHWALVGQIEDVSFWLRPRVTIKTLFGERVLVNFHLEGASKPTFFDWMDLQTQTPSTVIILYAVNRTFIDMNQGVRQESPNTMMVFPASLPELIKEVDSHAEANCPKQKQRNAICFQCGKPGTSDQKLSCCNRCKSVYYCGRECQISHWKGPHKRLCQHSAMLSKLSALDFSCFHDFVDWKFEVHDPPTQEEKQERNKRSMRLMMYEMGALAPELQSMPARLDFLLNGIGKKSLATDPNIQRYQETSNFMNVAKRDDPETATSLPSLVNESFLYQSLRKFADAMQMDPQIRHHVVDLGGKGNMSHFIAEEVLDTLFFVLPIWQHKEGIGKLSWAVESHAIFDRCRPLYERHGWSSVSIDHDSVTIKNRVSNTCVFATDNLEMVAAIAERLAADRPDEMVIRVLRVTANESWHDIIRKIATKSSVPDNLYTLWVREDIPTVGCFNPPREGQSLVQQLLDRERLDPIECILRVFGVPPQNILRRPREEESKDRGEQGNTNTDGIKCASCGFYKTNDAFSKTQLRTKGRSARCKDCVQSGQR